MASYQWSAILCSALCVLSVLSIVPTCMAANRTFYWEASLVNYTRNCVTKPILVINGQFPGPTIEVNEGDRVTVYVKNSGPYNLTIHWHGIRQLRTNWADGVAGITECPIKPNNTEIYDFVVNNQSGTTFWHAHITWLRATVYGAFITIPTNPSPLLPPPYPFVPYPNAEEIVILGEWFNQDVELIEEEVLASGSVFPVADTLTINGYPGPLYNCSDEGVAIINVTFGQTYLLRLINAALNTELFFAIANHTLTVVEADSNYVLQFPVNEGVVIGPGQTLGVLVTANQTPATYYMAAKSYNTFLLTDPAGDPPGSVQFVNNDVPPIPTVGFFRYSGAPVPASNPALLPALPATNDTVYSTTFAKSLKSLLPFNFSSSPNIRHLLYVVGTGSYPCNESPICVPPNPINYRVIADINNVTFVVPTTAILPAYYNHIPGVYTPDFPNFPIDPYNYTMTPTPSLPDQVVIKGTRVVYLEYGTVVQLVLQDQGDFAFESHPFHLHGHFFYIVGQGFGNYNQTTDPAAFNLINPPARFTVDVPTRGWVAIRFLADNPGVWYLHCHLEKHLSWGMSTVFITLNGTQPDQQLGGPLGLQTVNPC